MCSACLQAELKDSWNSNNFIHSTNPAFSIKKKNYPFNNKFLSLWCLHSRRTADMRNIVTNMAQKSLEEVRSSLNPLKPKGKRALCVKGLVD